MPIYEYKCKQCGMLSEHIQKFSDAPLNNCHDCGCAGSLEKVMSLSAFHLKGSGWYVTDYGRGNNSCAHAAATKTATKETTCSTDSTSESTKSTASKSEG